MRLSAMRLFVCGAALAALVAACSEPSAPAQPEEARPPPAVAAAPPAQAAPLEPLTDADLRGASLQGELACSFADQEGARLLFALGVVASEEPSQGLVKMGGAVQRVGAPGGFDAMLGGGDFKGAGVTVRIVLTGPPMGGGESPPRPATLSVEQGAGASDPIVGRWTCGP